MERGELAVASEEKEPDGECETGADKFCYVCGKFTLRKEKRNMLGKMKEAYVECFKMELIEDVWWAPNSSCATCYNFLVKWKGCKSTKPPFAVPMIWYNPPRHKSFACYFCVHDVAGHNSKTKKRIRYYSMPGAITPQPAIREFPALENNMDSDEEIESNLAYEAIQIDPDYVDEREPLLINQERFDLLVSDFYLPKYLGEQMGARFRAWNLLEPGVKTTQRNRHGNFVQYFTECEDVEMCYCNDIAGLMAALNIMYEESEWRLFMDSSISSFKAVLLHNGDLPTVPILYAIGIKETYENLKLVLDLINYHDHQWHICADLKVIAILTGLKKGYAKFPCFLCEWDSRDKFSHYRQINWPRRIATREGQKGVILPPLVDANLIYLPPLHLKLGLVKNFIKAMERNSNGFTYLRNIFHKLSDAKIEAGLLLC